MRKRAKGDISYVHESERRAVICICQQLNGHHAASSTGDGIRRSALSVQLRVLIICQKVNARAAIHAIFLRASNCRHTYPSTRQRLNSTCRLTSRRHASGCGPRRRHYSRCIYRALPGGRVLRDRCGRRSCKAPTRDRGCIKIMILSDAIRRCLLPEFLP